MFGEPEPTPVSCPWVAVFLMVSATSSVEAVGSVSRYSAATPATCGAAIEVPLIVLVALSLVYHAEVMLCPGANRSRQLPKLENEARASPEVEAPAVSAASTRAGEKLQALLASLPAAIA